MSDNKPREAHVLRNFIWWPRDRSHATAAGVGLLVVAVAGLSGLPKFPAFTDFEQLEGTLSQFLVWSIILGLANFVLLRGHARGDFASDSEANRPVFGTLVVLTLLFVAGWGSILVARGEVGMLFITSERIDVLLTLRCFFVGEGGLAMALMFSAIWKAPPIDFREIERLRGRAVSTLEKSLNGPIEAEERQRLIVDLGYISRKAQDSSARLGENASRRTEEWANSADYFIARLAILPENVPLVAPQDRNALVGLKKDLRDE